MRLMPRTLPLLFVGGSGNALLADGGCDGLPERGRMEPDMGRTRSPEVESFDGVGDGDGNGEVPREDRRELDGGPTVVFRKAGFADGTGKQDGVDGRDVVVAAVETVDVVLPKDVRSTVEADIRDCGLRSPFGVAVDEDVAEPFLRNADGAARDGLPSRGISPEDLES